MDLLFISARERATLAKYVARSVDAELPKTRRMKLKVYPNAKLHCAR
jgi:hypothetical protein